MTRLFRVVLGLGTLSVFIIGSASADSIWDRRNPRIANLIRDTRAHDVGDLLTIDVREATLFDGKEDRQMNKQTNTSALAKLAGTFSSGKSTTRSFDGSMNGNATSQRQLSGQADYKSDRTFTDRMTVRVVAVEPNGNLVVEGFRKRLVAKEERLLRVTGIVRPADIGAGNIIQSQYVANVIISYVGKGAESSYLNNGWLGEIMNHLWPF